ncbi:glycosyltransferase family 4 protein [Vibrio sp. 10N]|uniref:glycosyltransferase family 4 protein n=1 Tax=Vibrio sp. 10N TaxID=3058938 RepID=UPI002813F3E7|nr:glycosyltransferase family 4 protein [Vibrio sp. 10N]
MRKVLIMSHGHPDLNKGGAELAAYQFFEESLRQGDDAYFLARTDAEPHGGAAFSTKNSPREILMHTTHDDAFLFSNIKTRHLWGDFKNLIEKLSPEVVYIHHYFFIGIEAIKIIKDALPSAKIVVTLHEYLAICANGGLMKKTNGSLCYKSSTLDCSQCLKLTEKSPGDFYLRKRYLMTFFSYVDLFISPSKFLKDRYVEWGLLSEKITVIENGQPKVEKLILTKEASEKTTLCYIGQINSNKGLDVLLESIALLPNEQLQKVQVNIHGTGLDSQPQEFKKKISKLSKKHKDVVSFFGKYEAEELPSILQDADWVVVPSTWWENSPMVIQEAYKHQVPVIASNIGGMKEKVTDGVDGFHFNVGKPQSLARVIERVIANPTLHDACKSNIKEPKSIADAYELIVSEAF